MFKKIFKYSILIIAIYLWFQAFSPFVYKEIGGKLGLFPDDYRYGDLYRLSLLPQFKEKAYECPHANIPDSERKNIHLFVIGDSFTELPKVDIRDFPVKNYSYVHWAKQSEYQLNTSQKNILILETVERTFKDHFSDIANNFTNEKVIEEILTVKQQLGKQIEELEKTIVPKGTEERLEHTIFNYDFFLWFREIKALINLKLFNRTEDEVVLSKDKSAIFYEDEADSTNYRSAFYPVNQKEIDLFVANINLTREKYLKMGFDEVYLSIIPNKVSLNNANLGKRNYLISRIQNDKRVQTPIIDVYSHYIKSPKIFYLKSDTHWNCEGRAVWLGKVNSILLNEK